MELLGRHVCLATAKRQYRGAGNNPAGTGTWASLAARGLHSPVLFCSAIFGVLMLPLMVLAELTVIILKEYLAIANMTVLLKAVLNSNTVIAAHKRAGPLQGLPVCLCLSPSLFISSVGESATGPPRAVLQGCLTPVASLLYLSEHAQCPGS